MSYAAMDGSATQFAGQNGYMPECVRERDDESARASERRRGRDPMHECRRRLNVFFENEISAPALGWTEGTRKVDARTVDELER